MPKVWNGHGEYGEMDVILRSEMKAIAEENKWLKRGRSWSH